MRGSLVPSFEGVLSQKFIEFIETQIRCFAVWIIVVTVRKKLGRCSADKYVLNEAD